jgi:hypothetical protein
MGLTNENKFLFKRTVSKLDISLKIFQALESSYKTVFVIGIQGKLI